MATEATTARPPAIFLGRRTWLAALRLILATVSRLVLLAIALWVLVVVRTGTGFAEHALYFALAFALIFVALGATSLRAWVLYLGAFVLFAQLRGLADEVGTPVQYEYAIAMEKALFLGTIPSIWLQERFYTFARLGPLEFYTITVYLSYFLLPHVLALALWKWDSRHFKTYAIALMVTLYVGLLASAILPTAPPWLAGQLGHIPPVYQVIPDIGGEVTPGTYENAYEVAGANPVAAMPSLHSAVPFLMAIAVWKYRWARWLGAGYAVSMVFAVVYLGEHYAVDALAGWGLAAGVWVGVSAYLARREASEPVNAGDSVCPADAVPDEPAAVTESAAQVTGE